MQKFRMLESMRTPAEGVVATGEAKAGTDKDIGSFLSLYDKGFKVVSHVIDNDIGSFLACKTRILKWYRKLLIMMLGHF